MKNKIVVGSRKSRLAMAQTRLVIAQLAKQFPQIEFTIKQVVTEGDVNHGNLNQIGGKGIFVKEIERQLLDGQIDFAVHSLKDVKPTLPAGLMMGAYPRRSSPFDCLISEQPFASLQDLPKGARVGTNSIRRQGQLLSLRPDLIIVPIRGNIDTRLKKIKTDHLAGVILAESGLRRLDVDLSAYHVLSLAGVMMPAVGQGCLAIECREDDPDVKKILSTINDKEAAQTAHLEREFMRELGGSCNFPIGAYARREGGQLLFDGLIASPDGKHVIAKNKVVVDGPHTGKTVADQLLKQDKFGIIKGED